MSCLYELVHIPISRRCDGYYLRWYYNGWHYWLFRPGSIVVVTDGENYRTLGTKQMTIGSSQLTESQCEAIRTITNTNEIYIWTDTGWGAVRILPGSLEVFNNITHGYDIEITIIIGSRKLSETGFSPIDFIPASEPTYEYCEIPCIGNQIWMCKNYDISYPGSKVYNDDEDNRAVYGGLYTFNQANSSGFVPAGWRVPSVADFQELIDEIGDLTDAGGLLKEIGTDYWLIAGGTDTYFFAARGAGLYNIFTNMFQDNRQELYLWTTEKIGELGRALRISYDSAGLAFAYVNYQHYASVRLLKIADCILRRYGLLYNWYAATDIREIASAGWHVPTNAEMMTMITFIGGAGGAGAILKQIGLEFWSADPGSTDDYLFSARGSGRRNWDDFYDLRDIFHMITSTTAGANYYFLGLSANLGSATTGNVSSLFTGGSLRLLKDDSTLDYYVGNDNKKYRTVKIGTQVWLGENLAETKFRYSFSIIYGALYNWMAATDLRSIANAGWHVPTVADFSILVAYLGASAGGKLKEAGLTYWLTPNEGATNAALFYGRGTGYRHSDGNFYSFKGTGKLWSSDQQDANFAYFMGMYYYTVSVLQSNRAKQYGMNIRLIKDSTTLSHGQTGTYTGNDGKVYHSICVGTQEWMSENLCETKYFNTDDITLVEDGPTWSGLAVEGMCYFDNNIDNAYELIETSDNIPEVTDQVEWFGKKSAALCAYDNDWNNV